MTEFNNQRYVKDLNKIFKKNFDTSTGELEVNFKTYFKSVIDQLVLESDVADAKTKLWNPITEEYETAVVDTEYLSPEQHGNIYGMIYRQYFNATLPSFLTTGLNVEKLIDYTIYADNSFPIAGSFLGKGFSEHALGAQSVYIHLINPIGGGNNLTLANSGFTVINGWVDYTK